METLKKHWSTILLFFSSVATVAFFFLRASRPSPNSDTEAIVDKMFHDEKKKLNDEKSRLVKEAKAVDGKEESDAEIEKKYNS